MLNDKRKIEFLPSKNLLFIKAGADTINYIAVDSASLNTQSMEQYVGDYYSDEVEAKFSIIIKNDSLILVKTAEDIEPLIATYKDGFIANNAIVYFERNDENKITNMKISVSRARNENFKKL